MQVYEGIMDAARDKILVVDDDEAERDGVAKLLRLWGYEVKSACDGVQALEELSSVSVDLILTDLTMPRMSGMKLLKELESQPCSASCIIMSGERSWREEIEAIRFGAYSFLEKPVDPERLRTEIRDCLEARRSSGSLAPALRIDPPRLDYLHDNRESEVTSKGKTDFSRSSPRASSLHSKRFKEKQIGSD